MLLSDWPYGTTANKWDVLLPLDKVWPEIRRTVKPDGAILLFAQCPYDKILGCSNLDMLRYEWVWIKSQGTNFLDAKRKPLKATENILCFYQKLPIYRPILLSGNKYIRNRHINIAYHNNIGKNYKQTDIDNNGYRYPVNYLFFKSVCHFDMLHPTQKPVDLCAYLIKTYTNPGDLVLDNCAGSGTTAVAAIRTGRDFVAFEKDKDIFETAKARIEKELEASRNSLFPLELPARDAGRDDAGQPARTARLF
ncbi:MAG: site-specific DNA-methyltransferase [Deltaproteobacteria bacterium]|nr:site-specific DNA-methyltransferase [Deltaproteobacteria bacterium]